VTTLDSDAGSPGDEALAIAAASLARLPCPTVAIETDAPGEAADQLRDRFDVVLARDADLGRLLEAIHRTPLAAMALVQLLRHSAGLGIHDGLLAESLVYATLQSGPEFADWRARRPATQSPPSGLEPAVLAHRRDDRLELTLNRPEKRNAFSTEMRDALAEALRTVVFDASIREVVLRGAGAAFCSGGDLDEFGTLPDPATAHGVRSTRNPGALLAQCADRIRAELHGACVGAGIELPAFAHHVAATEDAFFQLPEVAMGLVPGSGGTVSIARRIGRQRTAYFALSGARLDAATAYDWGLIDEIRA
jgi:hypothetical protein